MSVSNQEAFREQTERLSRSDPDTWLGQLVWYSVSGVLIQHTALVQALAANNLWDYIPKLPSDVDIFRRVCTKAQKKRQPSAVAGGYENYLLRDIPMDGNLVHKVLVRETVEPGNLTYETQLSTLTFDKASKGVSHTPVPSGDVVAQQIVSDILVAFSAEVGALNSHAVRELIRKMLLDRKAVNVRGDGGGLYFMGREQNDFITNLEGFAAMLPGRVQVDGHPILDDVKSKDMLRRAFLTEVADQTDSLVIEFSRLLENKTPVSSAAMTNYRKQIDDARDKVAAYDKLLEDVSDTANSALDIARRQWERLLPLVKA